MKETRINLLPVLARIAQDRDSLDTNEFAKAVNIAPQTARKNHSQTGKCCGVTPTKLPNGRLSWSVHKTGEILTRSEK